MVSVIGKVCYCGIRYLLQGECVTTVCGTCYKESVLLQYVVPVTGRVCYYGKWCLLQGKCYYGI
jgi:hypothetical protein